MISIFTGAKTTPLAPLQVLFSTPLDFASGLQVSFSTPLEGFFGVHRCRLWTTPTLPPTRQLLFAVFEGSNSGRASITFAEIKR